MSAKGIIEFAFAVCALAGLFVFGSVIGASYEGKWYPVASKLDPGEIIEVDGGIIIHPKFEKLRNCTYLNIQFFTGKRGGLQRDVDIDLKYGQRQPETGITRPTGKHETLPWFIGMSKQDFLNRSFAIVSHRCWNPLYVVQTVFWERPVNTL